MRAVSEVPDQGIVMPDGVRLSARLWLPEDAGADPVPAILEMIPYRKRDGTAARDAAIHPWFAARGYACLRVDLRGSGDSGGLLTDEYTAEEWSDACAVIAWAAAQPWCTGAVGMMGKSWGAFNALQVAALQPHALRAVIAVCGTVDRFGDDIHFKGGCLLGENFGWASVMLSYSSRPADPLLRGDWREDWLRRLDGNPWLAPRWAAEQARGGYWRHGSVCEDWSRMTVPVLAFGGWADGYMNMVGALVAHAAGAGAGDRRPLGASLPAHGGAGAADRVSDRGAALVGSVAEERAERGGGGGANSRLHAGCGGAGRQCAVPAWAVAGVAGGVAGGAGGAADRSGGAWRRDRGAGGDRHAATAWRGGGGVFPDRAEWRDGGGSGGG